MKKRALIGLALCAAVLAASYPLLFGLEAYPRYVFYGQNVFSITPSMDPNGVNDTFAASLAAQIWASVVSPEIYAFSSWAGEPVVVRGVDPSAFLDIEGASLVDGTYNGDSFALVGEGFSLRAGPTLGERGLLAGSLASSIVYVTITGVYRSPTPSNDEILVPLDDARELASLVRSALTAVRIRTNDAEDMMQYLDQTGLSLAIASDEGTVYLNTPGAEDGRLSSLVFLYPELGRELGRSYIQTFAQQGINGVRVIVFAFIILISILAFAGIFAVVWRATNEGNRPIGILRVTGASPRYVVLTLLREFLLLGSLTILAGLVIGLLVAQLAGSYNTFLIFSHSVKPQFDLILVVIIYLVTMVATAISALVCARKSLRRSPRDLILAVEPRRDEPTEEVLTF